MNEDELNRFYKAVWQASNRMHIVMLKLILFTGIRNEELVNLTLENVDLDSMRIRISHGKGDKDRYVLFFNVYCGKAICPHNEEGLENLAHYIIQASFSQERMTYVAAQDTSDGIAKVIYQGSGHQMGKHQRGRLQQGEPKGGDSVVGSNLSETNFENADLIGCHIYAISAWNLKINEKTKQSNFIITRPDESTVMVDDLEVAQFVYLLLNNEKMRNVIDTIGEKVVLILGRSREQRKAVLDAIRDRLREFGFLPMMFDFEKPTQRDFTETIKTLAGLSRFIIADITNPKSSPLVLQATMPDYMIPFMPIIQEDEEPFAMFQDLRQKYGEWILDVLRYDSADNLLMVLKKAVVKPALKKADELLIKKAEVYAIGT